MVDYTDRSHVIGACRSYLYRTAMGATDGWVMTRAGIVAVYCSPVAEKPFTEMRFVSDGQREHVRTWERHFQRRYLITLADRFACEKGTP